MPETQLSYAFKVGKMTGCLPKDNSTYVQVILGYLDNVFRRRKSCRTVVLIGSTSDLDARNVEGLLEGKIFSFENQTIQQVFDVFNQRMDELCLPACIHEIKGQVHKLVYGPRFYRPIKQLISDIPDSKPIIR